MKIKNKADKLLTCEFFLIVILSSILTIYIMFRTNNCHIKTFFPFFISTFSLLLVCVSVFNWTFSPLKRVKEGISLKSKTSSKNVLQHILVEEPVLHTARNVLCYAFL